MPWVWVRTCTVNPCLVPVNIRELVVLVVNIRELVVLVAKMLSMSILMKINMEGDEGLSMVEIIISCCSSSNRVFVFMCTVSLCK